MTEPLERISRKMSDKTPGQRAYEKWLWAMGVSVGGWKHCPACARAAWEAAADEAHTAHIEQIRRMEND